MCVPQLSGIGLLSKAGGGGLKGLARTGLFGVAGLAASKDKARKPREEVLYGGGG